MTSPLLLEALAEETAALTRPVERLAGLLGELVQGLPPTAREAALIEAQAVDAVVQRLEGLSQVLAGLAAGASEDDVLAEVKLADLAARLKGADQAQGVAKAGDLMLFD